MRDPDYVGARHTIQRGWPRALVSTTEMVQWKAWRWRLQPTGKRERPDHDATLAMWLLDCPGAHAVWSRWVVSLIHLRPIAGVRPAMKRFPEAMFEMSSAALHPNEPFELDSAGPLPFLHPFDWVVQFHGVTDEQAIRVGELVVESCMSGRISPDSDFASHWETAIPATADHFARGVHS